MRGGPLRAAAWEGAVYISHWDVRMDNSHQIAQLLPRHARALAKLLLEAADNADLQREGRPK